MEKQFKATLERLKLKQERAIAVGELASTMIKRQSQLLSEYGIAVTNKLGSWQGIDLATGAVWGSFPSLECCIDSILASKERNI